MGEGRGGNGGGVFLVSFALSRSCLSSRERFFFSYLSILIPRELES